MTNQMPGGSCLNLVTGVTTSLNGTGVAFCGDCDNEEYKWDPEYYGHWKRPNDIQCRCCWIAEYGEDSSVPNDSLDSFSIRGAL